MAIAGHFWIEGTEIGYLDSSGNKRTLEGTLDGATGKTAGHIWIEGDNFRYIDSSGNERYIGATLVGSVGTTYDLCAPRGFWEATWNLSYSTIYNLASASWTPATALAQNIYSAQYHNGDTDKFLIYRAMISVDLSSLSPSISIAEAKLVCPYIFRRSNLRDIYIVMVDATGVTGNDAGYGTMKSKTTDLGSLLIPQGTNGFDSEEISFNSTGRTFLENNAGGTAQIGIRIDQEISGIPPDDEDWEYQDMFTAVAADGSAEAYITIASSELAGYIWVEGNNLHYIDASYIERYIAGTT